MYFSSLDIRLNKVSARIVISRGKQDVKTQLILSCIIYTNYNSKSLTKVRKLAILWDKFKELISRKDSKFAQKKREKENKVLICIYFEIS